jgi:hypothetical protein
VIDHAFRPGNWRRAGMEARVCGLDHAAVVACLPSFLDRDLATALAGEAEIGLLEGLKDS